MTLCPRTVAIAVAAGIASALTAALYSDEQPRAADGKFGEGSGGKSAAKSKAIKQEQPTAATKSDLAKASATYVGKDIQRYAEEHNEPQFAKSVGGLSYKDNEPVDVVAGKGGVVEHGVELKTMVANKASKLTMDKYAQVRKVEWEREKQAAFHTVVIDDRAVYNANGPGMHDESKRQYYYRRGIAGSVRVDGQNGMHKCSSIAEVKQLMNAPEKSLPAGAQRTDGGVRTGRWKAIQDSEGKGFKNAKTGEVVRPKK